MWRFLAGVASALLLVTAGLIWQRSGAQPVVAGAPAAAPMAAGAPSQALADPPAASDATREQKRFSRYDRDRDGKVSEDEFLLARHRAFAKLDANGDGRLSFEEYAAKTIARYRAAAGTDAATGMNAAEFAKTRIVRHAKPGCPPAASTGAAPPEEDN